MRFVLALALVALALPVRGHTQDFEREARWRSEVVPALVVGEAIDIAGPGGRPFLGLLTEPAGTDPAGTTMLVIVHGIDVHPDVGARRLPSRRAAAPQRSSGGGLPGPTTSTRGRSPNWPHCSPNSPDPDENGGAMAPPFRDFRGR